MALRAADLAWLRGDRESAYRRLTDQVATLAYDPRLTRRLALMASDLGDWDAALAHLQRLTEAGPCRICRPMLATLFCCCACPRRGWLRRGRLGGGRRR